MGWGGGGGGRKDHDDEQDLALCTGSSNYATKTFSAKFPAV